MIAAVYARKSTEQTGVADEQKSVTRQIDHARAYAVRKGWTADLRVDVETINGLPGVLLRGRDGLVQTTAFDIDGDVVKAIYVIRNPDKLRHLPVG